MEPGFSFPDVKQKVSFNNTRPHLVDKEIQEFLQWSKIQPEKGLLSGPDEGQKNRYTPKEKIDVMSTRSNRQAGIKGRFIISDRLSWKVRQL